MKINPWLYSTYLLLAAPSASPDEPFRDASRLLELTDIGAQFETVVVNQTKKIIRTYSSIVNMSESLVLPTDIKEQIEDCYAKVYAWDQFSQGIAEILAEKLTLSEIKLLIAFYSNLGLPPREIGTFKSLLEKSEAIEKTSLQYIYEKSASCVVKDTLLINEFILIQRNQQQSKLVSYE